MSARASQQGIISVVDGTPRSRGSQQGTIAVVDGKPKARTSQQGVILIVQYSQSTANSSIVLATM